MPQSPHAIFQYNYAEATQDDIVADATVLMQGAQGGSGPTADQSTAIQRITEVFINATAGVLDSLPPSADRTLVLRGLEDAKMRAVNAVFRTVTS
jgi:hypothetical protein